MNKTRAKLNLKDVWELTKFAPLAVFTSSLIFGFLYLLYRGASFTLEESIGGTALSGLLWYLLLAVVFYYIISNLTNLLNGISSQCADLAKMTDGLSFSKKALWVAIFLAYMGGVTHYPTITFFVTGILIFPCGATYDRYKKILRDKTSTQYDE